jgi:hypothetical protein
MNKREQRDKVTQAAMREERAKKKEEIARNNFNFVPYITILSCPVILIYSILIFGDILVSSKTNQKILLAHFGSYAEQNKSKNEE